MCAMAFFQCFFFKINLQSCDKWGVDFCGEKSNLKQF